METREFKDVENIEKEDSEILSLFYLILENYKC